MRHAIDLCEHISAEPLHSRRTHSHSERCRDRTEPHMRICSGCTFWVWCVARTLRPEEAARFIACMSEHATHNGGGFSGSLTMSTNKQGTAQSSKTSVLQRDTSLTHHCNHTQHQHRLHFSASNQIQLLRLVLGLVQPRHAQRRRLQWKLNNVNK